MSIYENHFLIRYAEIGDYKELYTCIFSNVQCKGDHGY